MGVEIKKEIGDMLTGYTAKIKDGIGFEKFVLQCARAFGTLVTMREDSVDAEIPDEFQPSDYYQKALIKAQAGLMKAKKLTLKDAARRAEEDYQNNLEKYEKRSAEKRDLKNKYTIMLGKVKSWQPPTPDHFGLKSFMIKQIEKSIDFDCGGNYDKPPRLKMVHEWLQEQIDNLLWDVQYYSEELRKEIERCNERTSWVKALKNSLSLNKEN